MTRRTLTLAVALLTTVAAVADSTYTVHRGETLKEISKKLGVSVEALRKANDLKSNRLKKGQVLVVPTRGAGTSSSAQAIGKADLLADTVAHAGPFDGSKSLDPVLTGSSLKVYGQKPGWMKLQMGSGFGWVPADLVKFTPAAAPVEFAPKIPAFAHPIVKKSSTANVVASISHSDNALLKKALTYRGVRYRWGGTSRASGVDCSGFTSSVFRSQGIELPRTSIEQSHVGKPVAKSDLKPGDLVFFRTGRSYRVNHVGLYVGDGKFIHAATGAGHVMVSSLGEKYYVRCYAMARRVADFETASRAVKASQRQAIEN